MISYLLALALVLPPLPEIKKPMEVKVDVQGNVVNINQLFRNVPWGEYDHSCGCQERQVYAWLPRTSSIDLEWQIITAADSHAVREKISLNYGMVKVRQFHWHGSPGVKTLIEKCRETKSDN